jgi:hypothetical protein
LTALLGVVAITLDGGLLLDDRWRAQAAADSAALAAAADLYANFSQYQGLDKTGSATKSALSVAAANGFSNDGTTSTVTVNIPAKSGDHAGQPGYAEVIVQFNQTRNFSTIFSLFNSNATGTIPVTARAVARGRMQANSGAGIVVLSPNASNALNVTGSASINVTSRSGPIIVNSNDSDAAVVTGNGAITCPEVDITGTNPGYVMNGQGQFATSPTANNIKTGVLPTQDPLANLPVPDPSTMPVQSSSGLNINQDTTLQPGVYTGGITITGGNITLAPGIYYMDQGGFSLSNGNVTGSGVMIYNNPVPASGQKVSITGGTFNLSAPTSGTYQGMAIFQARDAGLVPINISGSGAVQMIGAVYAASSPVKIAGNGDFTIGSEFICDTLALSGNGSLSVDWNGASGLPKRDIRLVE